MKKFVLGLIVGICITIPASLYAENVQQITAYVNPNLKITIDGEQVDLGEPAILYNHRTYLPLRWIAENVMGMEVEWDQETQTATLTTLTRTGDAKMSLGDEIFYELTDVTHPSLDEMTAEEIRDRRGKIKGRINSLKGYVDAAERYNHDPERFDLDFLEKIKWQLPRLEAALEYWDAQLAEKEAQMRIEQPKQTEEAAQ